jgi:hypothetical protein
MRVRRGYNPKRHIAPDDTMSLGTRDALLNDVRYGGNPEHKRSPGDYGLTPPAQPRPGKTLCDGEGPFLKAEAIELLKSGLAKGMVSVRNNNGWPQNVWAISHTGEIFEAQLENSILGIYHGYPMPKDDDFRSEVIREWKKR